MNERLKERIAEEWAMLDPVDPLRRLLSDVIDVLAQPAQGPRPWVELTDDQFLEAARLAEDGNYLVAFQRIQQWLKEGNT